MSHTSLTQDSSFSTVQSFIYLFFYASFFCSAMLLKYFYPWKVLNAGWQYTYILFSIIFCASFPKAITLFRGFIFAVFFFSFYRFFTKMSANTIGENVAPAATIYLSSYRCTVTLFDWKVQELQGFCGLLFVCISDINKNTVGAPPIRNAHLTGLGESDYPRTKYRL